MNDSVRTLMVNAVWEGGYRCEVAARQHRVMVDEPVSAQGSDAGSTPTELFLASLGSCFALAVHHVAAKRSLELRAIEIEVRGTYSGPSFSNLELEVRVDSELPGAALTISWTGPGRSVTSRTPWPTRHR